MARSVQIRARTDAETKQKAEGILGELGITPSAAINMFYRQIVMRRALPFPVEVPNEETRAAIDEARSGEGVIQGEDLPALLSRLLTKRERSFDVAELVESDPELLEAAERIIRAGG
jgi:DNA-damage-inducible protein J